MNLRHSVIWLPVFATVGCQVGLTTATVKTNDSGLEQTDEPSSELGDDTSTEPSSEPSTEPAGEPSGEVGSLDTDDDGDGYSENLGDCNDADASVGPHALEIPSDDFDQNCDGMELCHQDSDSDGYATETVMISQDVLCGNDTGEATAFSPTTDCDDYDPSIFPMSTEIPNDGIDQDCDGVDAGNSGGGQTDQDGDGYDSTVDCNDYNASIYPGAPEIANDGIDQDCDGVDSTSSYPDYDGDGYDSSIDCNDFDGSVYPGAYDTPNDGIDQDCDGMDASSGSNCYSNEMLDCNGNCVPISWSGDGFCDSGVNSWHGNTVDYNCASLNYEDGDCSSSTDYDGDGFDSSTDCNDYDASIYPGAPEIANDGIDQDCDGVDSTSSYPDYDGDGYDSSIDCNDFDGSVYPGAYDIPNDGIDQDCDGVDSTSGSSCNNNEMLDCNGNCAPLFWYGDGVCDSGNISWNGNIVDYNCGTLYYENGDCSSGTDNDGDGFDFTVDCNDSDASIYPGAPEIANDGIDQDCDGVDQTTSTGGCSSVEITDCNGNCAPAYWLGDGICDQGSYSYLGNPIYLDCASLSYDSGDCSVPDADLDGYDASVDCNDNDSSIYPGALEIPNDGIDQDCDGVDSTSGSPTSYQGNETYEFASAQPFPGGRNCNMQFTITGTPSAVSCPTCTYVFDMSISMDSSSIYNSTFTHCDTLSNSMVVSYGFVSNYNGTGEQALLLYENGSWVPFAINNTVNFGSVDTVNFNGSTFNYSVGYMDYYGNSYYGSGYHTNHWTGTGVAN